MLGITNLERYRIKPLIPLNVLLNTLTYSSWYYISLRNLTNCWN